MDSDSRRPRRVAEELRAALGAAFRDELSDPRLSSVVITRVDIGGALEVAHVFVRLLVGDEDQRVQKSAVRALSGAAPRLRRVVAPRLGLKRVPEIRFHYDESPEQRARVDELLDEIRAEASATEEEAPPGAAR